ncbi:MAG: hypothetical protein EAZ73_09105 [Oscillatoriales cyanobacterium]|uniref:hypothetical protein n=1 Tax=unclassified Microcoleus TaxID=2642155 RepID=UPI001DFFFC15|nr:MULTISPECIES: hypothetical protein [unclassified Microcoleus]TAF00866.1 MAG: hypothetical protein EAZ79_01490 [Oscillatoriales cyanobacterium]MCC3459796.1 hypothetical protein [Microcoleus sp. PH2017_11_PCY_U_A]MCC3478229.1 hypothetical protein [Microcoleus sp. PH2017_12_PCY_D_A]TAF21375.1 MAG: hypothetical protein EAZ73_09105 [Oscillatoriales cyanobacterium]TAF39698.1 MAG: hypothetical protein EAZ69_00240 [Oscillatoriales cyanobacterium]
MAEIWIGKQILPIVDTVHEAIAGGRDWYTSLPHIKFIMESPYFANVKEILTLAANLGLTVSEVGKVFCETVYGINLARNSKVYQANLAGRGLSILSSIKPSSSDKTIYEAAVKAHNETLDLPKLSVELAKIEAEISSIEKEFEQAKDTMQAWKKEALGNLESAKNKLIEAIKDLKGNRRRGAKVQLGRATMAETAMKTNQVPSVFASANFSIRSALSWDISSSTKYDISSLTQNNCVANAIVPVLPGAGGIVGAGAVIGSIASWLLSSFFLKGLAGFPMQMLDALKHTVTSIVLKVLGSSGANAYRFLAASVIKAGKSLIPVIFASTGMFSAAWTFLMPYALPIIGAAVIIIAAMKHKTELGNNLYVYGQSTDTVYSLATAHLYDTNRQEMREQLQLMATTLITESSYSFKKLYGVAANDKGKPVMVLNLLKDIQNPLSIVGEEALTELVGGDFATIMQTALTLF